MLWKNLDNVEHDNETEPCGEAHPLPCGLDEACPVPAEYFDAQQSNEKTWSRYTSENADKEDS